MAYRVLAVCTGNICRSPIAEVVLSDRFEATGLDVEVDSGGVSDEERGNPIDPRAAAVLREAGYPVPRRRAHQVSRRELGDADLVLAMTASHARALRRLAPDPTSASHVLMLRTFDPSAPAGTDEQALDVRDPWYGGPDDFQRTLDEIEAAADGIVERVRGDLAERADP